MSINDEFNKNDKNISWLEKYRPKNLNEYYMNKQQLDIVKTWIKDYRNNIDESKPFLILHGTTGIGKTTLAYLILQYYDYEIIECNASDARSKKHIKESLGQISKVSVCIDEKNKFKKVAIIMDEIDGLAGGESNSVQELIDIVTKDKDSKKSISLCPVICTTNSIKDKKLQPLIKQSVVLNINRPSSIECKKIIDKISKTENFIVPKLISIDIINKAYGDYRQIIMLLYSYYHSLVYKVKYSIDNINNIDGIGIGIGSGTDNFDGIDNKVIQTINNIDGIGSDNIDGIDKKVIENIDTLQYKNDEIINYTDGNEHYQKIKNIYNLCETPLDKINYLLTHKHKIDDISHICSADSNLYYMNFYINIIPVICEIQNKIYTITQLNNKTIKTQCLQFLSKIYNLLKDADLMNNSIFLDKNWELLEYFDFIGISLPLFILHNENNKDKDIDKDNNKNDKRFKNNIFMNSIPKYHINDFNLIHHTQYNFMRQEQSHIKKKFNVNYMKINDIDITNIYYNIKRFQLQNKENIRICESRSKKKKSYSLSMNDNINKYHIDRMYIKFIEKIDELLS